MKLILLLLVLFLANSCGGLPNSSNEQNNTSQTSAQNIEWAYQRSLLKNKEDL